MTEDELDAEIDRIEIMVRRAMMAHLSGQYALAAELIAEAKAAAKAIDPDIQFPVLH